MDMIINIKDSNISNLTIVFLNTIKLFLFNLGTYIITLKISNQLEKIGKDSKKIICIFTIAAIFYMIIRERYGLLTYMIVSIIFTNFIIFNIFKCSITYSSIISIISITINYLIFFIGIAIAFVPVTIFNIYNVYMNLAIVLIIYGIILYGFLKIRRIKNGITFLQKKKINKNIDSIIINISILILLLIAIFTFSDESITDKIGYALIIFAIIMFITIQKSLQIYYKQKLLVQELEETKNELEKKNKEIKELEQENLNFSKTSHTLSHKQKALEYKLNQLINQSAENELNKNNTNASKENNTTNQANKPENIETEQIQDIKERLAEISKDLYQNEKSTRLAQTGIKRIDDMLKYMQSESEKYNIKLELQITGNIHHMTNKIIEEKDLETLIADHVKNAIIAINHSKNENKSILVKLGKIEENYGLAIYDTGIEFEKETLENLGKKPSTTHAEEGGTGMGFMNTFDTINKYKASLIINEIGKESETNYTKAIIIKFDQKNEFKIDSYRQQKSTRTAKK